MDAKKHGELIGAKVVMSRKTGGRFTAFDGFVRGKNLAIEKGLMSCSRSHGHDDYRAQWLWEINVDAAYTASFASSSIWTPANARETGQPFLAASACSRNVAASMPGTSASV